MRAMPAGHGIFNRRALKPAVQEVTALGDFGVKLRPVKVGRAVVAIEMTTTPSGTHSMFKIAAYSAGRAIFGGGGSSPLRLFSA